MNRLFSKENPPEWVTARGERMNYYLYFCGQNIIYSLVTTYLVTYLLFQGVDTAKSAAVMLAVRLTGVEPSRLTNNNFPSFLASSLVIR